MDENNINAIVNIGGSANSYFGGGVVLCRKKDKLPPPTIDAVYESEDECIDDEGDDESVKKNYEFFDLEWEG